MSFSASPVQIYASKIAVFGMARDGIKASAYCSMRNWNIPRIFRPSVRVGAHRAINSGGMAPTLAVIQGGLPRRALALVLEWAQVHQAELLEDWQLCSQNQHPKKIQPLA